MPTHPCRCLTRLLICGSTLVLTAASDGPRTQGVPATETNPKRDEQQEFRTGVELVQLDVSVLDRHRRPIGDLTQNR